MCKAMNVVHWPLITTLDLSYGHAVTIILHSALGCHCFTTTCKKRRATTKGKGSQKGQGEANRRRQLAAAPQVAT